MDGTFEWLLWTLHLNKVAMKLNLRQVYKIDCRAVRVSSRSWEHHPPPAPKHSSHSTTDAWGYIKRIANAAFACERQNASAGEIRHGSRCQETYQSWKPMFEWVSHFDDKHWEERKPAQWVIGVLFHRLSHVKQWMKLGPPLCLTSPSLGTKNISTHLLEVKLKSCGNARIKWEGAVEMDCCPFSRNFVWRVTKQALYDHKLRKKKHMVCR